MSISEKVTPVIENVRLHWKTPAKGRYMNYKEIISYAGGGIGAYFIISMGAALLVSTTNMIVGGAIGVDAMDMYYLYVISTIANIPLTAIRANMIDNARNKKGKYRPYLISMGIPSALIAVGYVWFPYEGLTTMFTGTAFGKPASYIATCAVVLVFNLLLQFFYNFFNDAYTNLIHVLSPNTQERTDVLAIKSVVYSFAPSVMNIVLPVIAQLTTNNDLYDLKVYRIGYPIFAVIGMLLTIIVFANTKEKIIQAKTHTRQLSFWDSLKAVAHNKYFWIIALAGWVGFLEGAYGNILTWSYNYGHTTTGTKFALIQTLTGNACLWGMILAPICIRKWGKKKVLLFVNGMNVICIISMLGNMRSIWWLFICVYFNWLVGAFEQITTPAIQADIRDYQQYITGERIDGMFATVLTIGSVVTLITSSILPAVQKSYGVYQGNGYEKPFDILDVTTGEPELLYKLMGALIIMAAIGAFLNMVPYFFYDFTEVKQKSVVRILKVRALFEDYGNNALKDEELVEAIDLVEHAREMVEQQPVTIDKAYVSKVRESTKGLDKDARKVEIKAAKKQLRANKEFNEDIIISQAVVKELEKFNNPFGIHQHEMCKQIVAGGCVGIRDIPFEELKKGLQEAKALPKNTEEEKELRKFEILLAQNRLDSRKYTMKYYLNKEIVKPSFDEFAGFVDQYEKDEKRIADLYNEISKASTDGNKDLATSLKKQQSALRHNLKELNEKIKHYETEEFRYNRATKAYYSANKVLTQYENYQHFNDIAEMYEESKKRAEQAAKQKEAEALRLKAEADEEKARLKAEKAAKKAEKKDKPAKKDK